MISGDSPSPLGCPEYLSKNMRAHVYLLLYHICIFARKKPSCTTQFAWYRTTDGYESRIWSSELDSVDSSLYGTRTRIVLMAHMQVEFDEDIAVYCSRICHQCLSRRQVLRLFGLCSLYCYTPTTRAPTLPVF